MTTRPAEHLIHGLDGPVVVVSARVAAVLLARTDLGEYPRHHRGVDREVDETVVGLKLAARQWRAHATGSDQRTPAASGEYPGAGWPPQLSTAQAAARLGITPRAVVKAIHTGRLHAEIVGARWLITAEEVEHYRARRAA